MCVTSYMDDHLVHKSKGKIRNENKSKETCLKCQSLTTSWYLKWMMSSLSLSPYFLMTFHGWRKCALFLDNKTIISFYVDKK